MDEQTAKIISRMQGEIDRLKAIELPAKTCSARYTTNAGQSIANNTLTIVDFEDSSIDTDSAVTTGAAWKFTCPTGKSGYYHVDAMIQFANSATWAAGELLALYIYKGGAQYSVPFYDAFQSATALLRSAAGADVVYLAGGEYIDVRVIQASGGALALNNNGAYNRVSIYRI